MVVRGASGEVAEGGLGGVVKAAWVEGGVGEGMEGALGVALGAVVKGDWGVVGDVVGVEMAAVVKGDWGVAGAMVGEE